MTLTACLAGAAVAAPAAGAARLAAHPSATAPADVTIALTLAPVRTSTGVSVTLSSFGCGKGKSLAAEYDVRRGTATLTHFYSGTLASCHVTPALTSGNLTAAWSDALRLNLRLRRAGTVKVTRDRVARNCDETTSTARYVATGQLLAAIHPAAFGTVRRSRTTVTLTRLIVPACEANAGPSTGGASSISGGPFAGEVFLPPDGLGSTPAQRRALENGDTLLAQWGDSRSLDSFAAPGTRSFVGFSEPATDGLTPSIRDTLDFELRGGGAFTSASDRQTANFDFSSPLSSGSLTFTAGAGCPPGIRAADGTLSGTATIDDPVLGTITFTGAQMGEAQLAVYDSQAYRCEPKSLSGE